MTSSAINSILSNPDYFLLLLFRVGALFMSSPIFGRTNIPQVVKISFMGVLTFLFFIIGPEPVDIAYGTLMDFFLLIAREVIVGLVLGFVLNLFFQLTLTAGQLIDTQLGFGMVSIYDPQTNMQAPIMGSLLNYMLLLIFFLTDGHQRLIYIVYFTLESMPVGTLSISRDIAYVALELFAQTFSLGVMIAMPIVASGLVLEICFGALARTVPQLNMFVVGIPIKTIIGLAMMMVLIPSFSDISADIFDEMFKAIEMMFSTLKGA